ncbi:MAG: alpha-amylase/4-alpha-glucanotransferase domain-containing protein [Candidatus Bipolaricaulaceae bacterium]
MTQVDLVFGVHCHQPVGNFPEVVERACGDAYLPLLTALDRHPAVKAVVHMTGPLWEHLEAHRPEVLALVGRLVDRGQVELLGGGFYEPILAAIPPQDVAAQLARMRAYLKSRFGQDPVGIWLAERVWEPHLPSLLSECNVRYLPVDDTHFPRAGLLSAQISGYYLTEDRGCPVGVFPISGRLRYLIPFRPLDEVMAYFRAIAAQGGWPLLVLVDGGEKFGVWPGTKRWVHDEGWLEQFLRALVDNAAWLGTTTLREAFAAREPLGRVYLPATSYFELGESALPAAAEHRMEALKSALGSRLEESRPLLSGGFWRGFLTKYPEANYLHKRMLRLSERASRAPAGGRLREEPRKHLLRAQCNDAYWHGLFGGIYLPHLRDALWRELLSAQWLLDRLERGQAAWGGLYSGDLDVDGHREVVAETEKWNVVLSPRFGSTIVELSDKTIPYNFLNVVARRPEGYHRCVPADAGEEDGAPRSIHEITAAKVPHLESYLVYDRHPRAGLVDHLFRPQATLDQRAAGSAAELVDLQGEAYAAATQEGERGIAVSLAWQGSAGDGRLRLEKMVRLSPGGQGVCVRVGLENSGPRAVHLLYGMEFNFGMLAGDAADRYFQLPGRRLTDPRMASRGEERDVTCLRLVNDWEGWALEVQTSRPALLWRHPVHTVNNSEAGFELVYQASCVVLAWELCLSQGGCSTLDLSLRTTGRRRGIHC